MANSSVFVVRVRAFLLALRASRCDTVRGRREECKVAGNQTDQSDRTEILAKRWCCRPGKRPGKGRNEKSQSFELQFGREGHKSMAELIPARGHSHGVSLGSTPATPRSPSSAFVPKQ